MFFRKEAPMKRTFRFLILLVLVSCIMSMTAFADMGPKPQLTVKVEHPPQEVYWLDLLAEGDPSKRYPLSKDDFHFGTNLKELGFPDAERYYAMNDAVPEGWHACITQPHGAPIWGSLIGEKSGDTILHSFGYFGVPRTYRILIMTESGEIWISDIYSRTALQSSVTLNWETKEVDLPSVWVGYSLQFLATFVPTLLMEGLILFLFRYRQKRSWAVFGIANLTTQGALAAALSIEAVQSGVSWGFTSLLVMAEGVILVVEAIAYVLLWKEHDRERALSYALAANTASALIGWLISEPVWRFVVSIS